VVRKRGQLSLCTLRVERMPSTTTLLRRRSVTAPAPRVVYQRTLLDTVQDPPVTTTALPDDELTPLDELEELVELADGDVDDVAVDEAVPDDEDELPGMVAALTAAKTPTPASAPTAAPTVRRCSKPSA
jgi:hypothetical protein